MIVIKTIISMLIISTSSLIGFFYGGTFRKRAKNLQDLEYCIRILESEIMVGNNPLPLALKNVDRKGRGEIAKIFSWIIEDLEAYEREDIFASFLSLDSQVKDTYLLNNEDMEILMYLGKILGKTNRIDQGKNFEFAILQIQTLCNEANNEKKIYEKLYRSLGVLLGLGLVIIIV